MGNQSRGVERKSYEVEIGQKRYVKKEETFFDV